MYKMQRLEVSGGVRPL